MRVIGTIEADLAGAREYREGGIGPLFGETRVEEALSVDDLLYRFVRALERLDGVRVLSLYLDEAEVYRDIEGQSSEDGAKLGEALDLARDAIRDMDEPTYVGLTVAHEDAQFYHVIFLEANTDHEVDEAALVVLDTAEVLEGEGTVDEAKASNAEAPAVDDEQAVDEPNIAPQDSEAGEDALFAFLEQLEALLGKELQLVEPEIDVWTDYTGEYRLQQAMQPPTSQLGLGGGVG